MAARGFQAAYWKGKHCIHLGAYPAADLLLDLEYMRLELGILRLGVIIGWKEASSNSEIQATTLLQELSTVSFIYVIF